VAHRYCEFFFLPLVGQLANAGTAAGRQLVCKVLQVLIKRVNPARLPRLREMCLGWVRQDKAGIRRAAIQLAGLFVEVEGKAFQASAAELLSLLLNIVVTSTDEVGPSHCAILCSYAAFKRGRRKSLPEWPILLFALELHPYLPNSSIVVMFVLLSFSGTCTLGTSVSRKKPRLISIRASSPPASPD